MMTLGSLNTCFPKSKKKTNKRRKGQTLPSLIISLNCS
jgi:hypothetical protein